MAIGKIKQIPDIREQIVDAVNRNTLAVFIGAGVSRTLGCAGWDKLSERLIDRCTETKNSDGTPCLGEQGADVLKGYNDNKKKITICKRILVKSGCKAAFFDEIEESLKADPDKLKTRNIYNELPGFRALFITTNMDEHFDVKFTPPKIAYRKVDFVKELDRNKLYHIHGKISEPASMVLTIPQYLKRYNTQEFQDFLTSIFAKYTVLFIGYGMEEFEVLDFIVGKYRSSDKTELKHYILKAFKPGDGRTLKFEECYYNSMGIAVIPYIENDDYGRLYDVIRAWNQEINRRTRYLHESFRDLEECVKDPSAEGIEDALQFIWNDAPQRRYLFKLLETAANPQPWLETLYDHGYLDPDRNPRPQKVEGKTGYYNVPYWEVLGFLENVAAQNLGAPSEEITRLIIEILEDIICYRTKTGERIDNHYTDASMMKVIFSLPLDTITSAHYEFIKAGLKTSWETIHIATAIGEVALPRFIAGREKEHLLKVIDVTFEYQHQADERVFEEYVSRIEPFWINEILKDRTREIAGICGHEAAEVVLRKIHQITTQDSNQFNHVWIPAIEKEGFPDRFDVQIIEFIRTVFEDSDPELLRGVVEELIYEEHPIFNRIAIHTINYHYDVLKELFWSLDYNPIVKYQLDHEVHELFKSRCASFSQEEIIRAICWIHEISAPEYIDPAQRELHTACARKWWLSTIIATGDPGVRELYDKYEKICPMEVRVSEDSPATVSFIGDLSPVTQEELLGMSTSEIVQYLCSYTEKPGFEGFSSRGLARVFSDCVATAPDKFYGILKQRPQLPSMHLTALLRGFANVGEGDSILDWNFLLDYILYLVESEEFWREEAGDARYGFDPEVVIGIGDLITKGVSHDEYISKPELHSKTERILTILADRTKPQLKVINGLEVSWAVMPQTSVFRATISYSVRVAPICERESGSRWVSSIRDQFSERLNQPSERTIEFSAVLGASLPDLYYLDEGWVRGNLDEIFPQDNEDHWRSAFKGYIRYTGGNRMCYRLLRDHGDYSKAIKAFDDDSAIQKSLIEGICRGYLNGEEDIHDSRSLISEVIEYNNPEQISWVIERIWRFNKERSLSEEMKERVKTLWGKLVRRYAAGEIDSDKQKILAGLFDWISVFDEIDDEMYEWLKVSAAHVRCGRGGLHFFDYLLKHAVKTPEKVGELILINSNAGGYTSYKKEILQQIVNILYHSGQKEKADRICNSYLDAGYDYLREIYAQNNFC
ncbi:SIR2 family protein [Methanoculleus bourgensis]|jgi:hypothetical protein|uniref:Uncharacterized protein n=1 Tax=Methanoculleus bourgensis TaxID=83986 RepID=A0A0X3BPJ7_9EURY|nr:SIR2 family protein [Methanoculleus bourgensis]CVK33961.1 conserved protein of unknown function [Methanoculleus bourgensis]